ncbi:MAG TPA: GNAT family N-acetyltransferase [Candidatus Sulfotelmatobacter sp.]|nr:GNAT family N-acetyltransferase [Candidatus Sulfotelmatobacter sp.]
MTRAPCRAGAARPLVIEPAGPAHVALLTALHGRCFTPGWPTATMASLVGLPGTFGLLATELDNGAAQPVGFALARVAADEAELLSIGVVPEHQRRGIARRLIAACVERVGGAGARALFLEVGVANEGARTLYESLGFRIIGRRHRYYRTPDGGFEDAVVMRRDLVA